MVKISPSDVKKLRDLTGSGLRDCKLALTEAEGDFDKAIEILRKKGQKVSAKRADRDANEGCIIALVSDDKKTGVIVKMSCETDFVAKNPDFVSLTTKLAQIALDKLPETVADLEALPFDKISIKEKVLEQVGVIGEKIELSYEKIAGECVSEYIHLGNRAGVLVSLNKHSEDIYNAGRDVAMQVAAMKPVALNEDQVDQSVIEKEIEIGKEVARQEGKPEAMLEKIAKGKLSKFFKENTLVNQVFVKDNKVTIAEYLKSVDPALEATGFKHIADRKSVV